MMDTTAPAADKDLIEKHQAEIKTIKKEMDSHRAIFDEIFDEMDKLNKRVSALTRKIERQQNEPKQQQEQEQEQQ